jgi:hypothetical protein
MKDLFETQGAVTSQQLVDTTQYTVISDNSTAPKSNLTMIRLTDSTV